jgi:hypothetical protein
VDAVKSFLDSHSKVLVCTHATFRFAVERFGVGDVDGAIEQMADWEDKQVDNFMSYPG